MLDEIYWHLNSPPQYIKHTPLPALAPDINPEVLDVLPRDGDEQQV